MLGGMSTVVASILARARGSNEPEASKQKANALSHFMREAKAFSLDFGHKSGREWDDKINGFRLGLENILGNRPGSLAISPTGKAGADMMNPGAPDRLPGVVDAVQGLPVVG